MSMAMAVAGAALRTPRVWTVASLSKNASDASSLTGPIPLAPPCMCAHLFVLSCCMFDDTRSLECPFRSLDARVVTHTLSPNSAIKSNNNHLNMFPFVQLPVPCCPLPVSLVVEGRAAAPVTPCSGKRTRGNVAHTLLSPPPPLPTHTHLPHTFPLPKTSSFEKRR